MVPGVRGLISIPAGVAHMNIGLFLLANFIGTLAWCTVLAVAGRILGANFTRIHQFLGPVGWTILGILIAGLGIWAFARKRRRARGQRACQPGILPQARAGRTFVWLDTTPSEGGPSPETGVLCSRCTAPPASRSAAALRFSPDAPRRKTPP